MLGAMHSSNDNAIHLLRMLLGMLRYLYDMCHRSRENRTEQQYTDETSRNCHQTATRPRDRQGEQGLVFHMDAVKWTRIIVVYVRKTCVGQGTTALAKTLFNIFRFSWFVNFIGAA